MTASPDPVPPGHSGQLGSTETELVHRAATVARQAVDDVRDVLVSGAGTSRRHVKDDGSPVTDVDRAVDDHLVEAFTTAFPDHAVVSEEGDTTWDGRAWTWVVDPIDGTSNYVTGVPWWSVSVALAHHGEVVWGMVDAPTLDRRWEAILGGGTTRNGTPVRVAAPFDLSRPGSAHQPIAVTPGTIRRRGPGTHFKPRVLGSAALDLALVADGSLHACYQRVPKVWDVAAGSLLVSEAGGAVLWVDEPGHLPLRTDVDLASRSVVTAAGPDRTWTRDLVSRLWPDRAPGG